jgi:serine/threonine protein kinase
MDHPNIARVLDGGTTSGGRPYFVMELVRGVPITKYCDEANLPLAGRLTLFTAVCGAIQHAHQKGIIHRDIKPSNILVATGDDGQPAPRVIDFGIARVIDRPLTDKTLFTQFDQMLGTPAYMSPEQVGAGPVDIDTRSDIYSLGVLLYEMLTGQPPFDSKELLKGGLDEMRRVILEDEPPRPSTRLSSMAKARLSGLARTRRTAVPKLISRLKGDLDWIVVKALEKNRARRYDSANAFAADVERCLRQEPVSARPPSVRYRAGKFVRKHKGPVIAAAVVTLSMAAAITVSTSLFLREKSALKLETTERETVRAEASKNAQTAGFLEKMLSALNPGETRGADDSLLMSILANASKRAETELKGQPQVEARLRTIIGKSYTALGRNREAQDQFERASKIQPPSAGPRNSAQ